MKKLDQIFLALVCLYISNTVYAESLTIERIFQSPALEGTAPKNLQISPDGKRVTFLKGKESDYQKYDLWEYDVQAEQTRMLFDSNDLISGKEILSDKERARLFCRRGFLCAGYRLAASRYPLYRALHGQS